MSRPDPRTTWTLFSALVACALVGACVATALATGSRPTTALVLLGGLVTLGIAAALVSSVLPPVHQRDDATHVPWGSTGWFRR